MICKVFSIKDKCQQATFTNRTDAQGYIRFNDPEHKHLFYIVESTKEDFVIYAYMMMAARRLSLFGCTFFC